jgi:HEPN domain-containing protein
MVSFISHYQILYNKAKADLSAANILYARFNEGNTELDLEVICFHLQQCAEKLIKNIFLAISDFKIEIGIIIDSK